MGSLASKHDILTAQDWDTTTFDVEKWGTVRIRSLSAKERLDLIRLAGGADGQLANDEAMKFYVSIIAMSLIDEAGQQIFDAANDEDIAMLQTRCWARLEHVATKIMEFNGMATDEQKEMVKN